jgi:hypothetical protein
MACCGTGHAAGTTSNIKKHFVRSCLQLAKYAPATCPTERSKRALPFRYIFSVEIDNNILIGRNDPQILVNNPRQLTATSKVCRSNNLGES